MSSNATGVQVLTDFITDLSDNTQIEASTLIIGVGPQSDGAPAHNAILHLIEEYSAIQVAELDSDVLFDMSTERPQVLLDESSQRKIEWPQASFWYLEKKNMGSKLRDSIPDVGTGNILFFTSPEPQFHWKRIADEIIKVTGRLEISTVILLSSFDGPVPYHQESPILVTSTAAESDSENPAHDLAQNIATRVSGNFTLPRYQGGATFTMALGTLLRDAGLQITTINAIAPFYVQEHGSPHAIDGLIGAFDALYGVETNRAEIKQEKEELEARLEDARTNDSTFDTFITALESQYVAWQENFVATEESELSTEDIIADVEALFEPEDTSNT